MPKSNISIYSIDYFFVEEKEQRVLGIYIRIRNTK
jgi:hypothetical protein